MLPPGSVYAAFVDEMNGKTSWWAPHHTFRLLCGDSFDAVGARLESTVQTKWPVKYTTETVEAVPVDHVRVRYIGGSFRAESQLDFRERRRQDEDWMPLADDPGRLIASDGPVSPGCR